MTTARRLGTGGGTSRRDLLRFGTGAAIAATLPGHRPAPARTAAGGELLVGSATIDISPPMGIELAGFHRPPDDPRLVTGSRQATAARAIAVAHGDMRAAIVTLDILAVSAEFARELAQAVEARVGIPADHVRICATHTHSMPTFCFLRQWGRIPVAYRRRVIGLAVDAVDEAWRDLAASRLLVGSSRVEGGNSNRTVKPGLWRTDEEFGPASDDSDRWLDTMLHAFVFERSTGRPPIIGYHFCAHPVCFQDTLSGPDWPGIVADGCRRTRGVEPVFLQGHIGDVNPGDGSKWIGDVEPTAQAVWAGLDRALDAAREVAVDRVGSVRRPLDLPLDLGLHSAWLDCYRADPDACQGGPWVDRGFAEDWFQAATAAAGPPAVRPTTLSALRFGSVVLVFHPAELYSVYGLAIRRDALADTTLCVGYADDFVGYLTDAKAYDDLEYAAVTVPKMLGLPPFRRVAAWDLVAAAIALATDRS